MARAESEHQFVVALDVGTSGVRCLISEGTGPGSAKVIGRARVASHGVKKGEVVHFHEATKCVKAAVERAAAMAGVKVVSLFAAVGCGGIRGLNSRGVVRQEKGVRVVSQEAVQEAFRAACEVSLPSNRAVLHIMPRGISVNGLRSLHPAQGLEGEKVEAEVHVITAPAEALEKLARVVEAAGYTVEKPVAEPLATGLSVFSEAERKEGVNLVKLGAGSIGVVAFREGQPSYVSTLGIGGEHMISDVASATHVESAQARDLCRNLGTERPSAEADSPLTDAEKEARRVARARLSEILRVAKEELAKATHLGPAASGVRVVGWLSVVPGVLEEVEGQLACRARHAEVIETVAVDGLPPEAEFASAAGVLEYGWRYRCEGHDFDLTAASLPQGRISRLLQRVAQIL